MNAKRLVKVREAVDGDADALASLSTQLGYRCDADLLRERLRAIHARNAGKVFLAADENQPLGWLHIVERNHLHEPLSAEITGLIVDESTRGLGVGAALLRAAEEWAIDNGIGYLCVRSNVTRLRAHRFYVRENYREHKRQVVFGKELSVTSDA